MVNVAPGFGDAELAVSVRLMLLWWTPVALEVSSVPARTLTPSDVTEIPFAPSTEIASASTVIPFAWPTARVGVDPSPVPEPVRPSPPVMDAT